MSTTTAPEPTVTERLVSAISAAWQAIQARHADVADVVTVLGAGTENPKRQKWGHFAAGRWQQDEDALSELFVAGEGLKRPVEEVFATLLHESAHCIAHTRGLSDTSRQGRYHNKRFAKVAEEVGLVVEHDKTLGWSLTRLPPSTAEAYRDELAELGAALTIYRHAEVHVPGGKRKDTNNAKATCDCPRVIRVARSTLDEAPIICGACDTEFAIEETGDEDQD